MTNIELEEFCVSCITKYIELLRKKEFCKTFKNKDLKVYAYNLVKKEKAVASEKSL